MSEKEKYHYLLRPGYGSQDLLIQMVTPGIHPQVNVIMDVLEKNGFVRGETIGFLTSELSMSFKSAYGEVDLSYDHWEIVFILPREQEAILFVDEIFMASGIFVKDEADFSKYIKP